MSRKICPLFLGKITIHLRGYGWITVFRFVAKNGRTDYIGTNQEHPALEDIKGIIKARWKIEVYHRELKQTCGIERCQSRTGRAQRNHIFLSISAWIEKHKRRGSEQITFYRQHWEVIKDSISVQMIFPRKSGQIFLDIFFAQTDLDSDSLNKNAFVWHCKRFLHI